MGLIYKGFLKIFHKIWKNVEVEDQKRMKTLVLPDDVSFEDFKGLLQNPDPKSGEQQPLFCQ